MAGNWEGFGARLREVEFDCSSSGASVSGHFYYLSLRDGEPTLEEFVAFIYWQIVPFCIPRAERDEADRKYVATKNSRYVVELIDKAKELFVAARKSLSTSGEPGELILFMLLEAALGAPQVACKMYLKTARNVPVHGSDAVHALYDRSSDILELIWGESKLYEQLPSALDKMCESLTAFIDETNKPSSRDRDVNIILDHMSIGDTDLEDALCKYFDPYEESANRRIESYACMAGFDFVGYEHTKSQDAKDIENHFRSIYIERIRDAVQLFDKKLIASNLQHLRFRFFLLPFPSVKAFRKAFFLKLGVLDADTSL